MLFKSVSDLTNLVKTKDLPKRLRRAWKSCKTYHVIFYIVPACSHFLLYINIKTHFRLNSRIACDILYSNLFLQILLNSSQNQNFVLDEQFQQTASKIVIYEKPAPKLHRNISLSTNSEIGRSDCTHKHIQCSTTPYLLIRMIGVQIGT